MGSLGLCRQGSMYDLTLDEVQNQLGNLGKPLGSMNLDELLRSVWTAEAIDKSGLQSSFLVSQDLSKKTVEEVWREIQLEKRDRNNLGEMTLEAFLAEAGVSVDSNNQWIQYQLLPQHVVDSVYSDSSMSDTQPLRRKRVASGDVVQKTVEKRQKRMIKNRESAARSRLRRQAYTHELENKVARLEEDNKRLKTLKQMEKLLPSAPPPEPKHQLRRTSSCQL